MSQQQALSLKRIAREEKQMTENPIPNVMIKRKGDLVFHFCIYGLSEPYQGGLYHGKVQLHSNYPFQPPKIMMVTPSGRFDPSTPVCTTFSNYHKESWSAAWSIRTIVLGFLSFMLENGGGIASRYDSNDQKKALAKSSIAFNKKNAQFVELFKADLKAAGINLDKTAPEKQKKKVQVEQEEEQEEQPKAKTGKGKKDNKVAPKPAPKTKKIVKEEPKPKKVVKEQPKPKKVAAKKKK